MSNWQQHLRYDPLSPLLSSNHPCISYFTRRDLLDEVVGPISDIWALPEPQKILRKQREDGSWDCPGKKQDVYPPHHYSLVETWKQFLVLVGKYEFTIEHPVARTAAEYLLSCQTDEGDIRGMIGNQYATYYTGAILSLLIQAGYQDEERVEKGMTWLLSMRQDDGGWTIPILTADLPWKKQLELTGQYAEPIQPDRGQPFSHNWTGMVLRAFAVHPRYRTSNAARQAARLLKTRFFQADCYSSYQSADYWVKLDYPYWWNHLLAALDSISMIEPDPDDRDIRLALDWFVENQQDDGLWKTSYVTKTEREDAKTQEKRWWISLAICRVMKRIQN